MEIRPAGEDEQEVGALAIHAATGWICICIPLCAAMYVSLVFFLRMAMRRAPSEVC